MYEFVVANGAKQSPLLHVEIVSLGRTPSSWQSMDKGESMPASQFRLPNRSHGDSAWKGIIGGPLTWNRARQRHEWQGVIAHSLTMR